ncbi:MAG: hypothetical protein QNJ16_21625 [Rhodobacter sp.]|nr:hypothetical protein [Rhodobacter sp.]
MPYTLSKGLNAQDILATSPTKPDQPAPTKYVMRNVALTPGIPPFSREERYHLWGGQGTPDITVKFEQMTGTPTNPPISIYLAEI